MEQTLVYPAIHPTDKLPNDKLHECKGLLFNIANHSIKKKRKFECKELIIDIDLGGAPGASEASRCPDKYCIYRVPKRLREVNNMAYTPRLVSIGPFHHRSEELKDMDIQKFLILKKLCDRTGKSIEDLKRIIRPKEEEIRSCYSETFLLTSDGFLNMILLDAIFILELFYRKYEKENNSGSSKAHDQIDYILSRPCLECGIQPDLLLLENQLPFFVLEMLYQNWDPNKKAPTLIELSCGFFSNLIYYGSKPKSKKGAHVKQYFTYLAGRCCHLQPSTVHEDPMKRFIASLVEYFYPGQQKPSSPEPKKEVKHLTDLVRYFFYPPYTEVEPKSKCCPVTSECTGCSLPPNQEQEDEYDGLYYTATKLDEAGLKFTTRDSTTEPLIKIQFRENCCLENFPCFNLSWLLSCLPFLKSTCLGGMQPFLEVPRIPVDDQTEGLFRNLMALEQCHYPSETVICEYIVLLDDLITTEADVRLLVDNKIIVNNLGSYVAVMELFNKLGLEIRFGYPNYYDKKLYKELNKYCDNPWNSLLGILTRTYFSDFFKGTATVVGIIVLVLTLWNFSRVLTKV